MKTEFRKRFDYWLRTKVTSVKTGYIEYWTPKQIDVPKEIERVLKAMNN
ncbi:MAG: hypothetical protein ACKPFA_13080 [Dolichospermum sp.]